MLIRKASWPTLGSVEGGWIMIGVAAMASSFVVPPPFPPELIATADEVGGATQLPSTSCGAGKLAAATGEASNKESFLLSRLPMSCLKLPTMS